MNIPFLLKVKPIDEYGIGNREDASHAKELVLTLAKSKADALIQGLLETNTNAKGSTESESESESNTDTKMEDKFNLKLPNYTPSNEYIILTADQVVTCHNSILEKPNSIPQALEFIQQYASHPPQTVGSIVLTHLPSNIQVSNIDISTIHFHSSIGTTDNCQTLVDRLLQDDAPILSCAGGLMVEHEFVKEYINFIDGSEDGVMGLSKDLVLRLLGELKEELELKRG